MARKTKLRKLHTRHLGLEALEARDTPTVTWTPLAGPGQPSGNISTMLLMPNGQDLVEDGSGGGGSFGDGWYLLTPDGQGNYVNGGFTPAGSFAGDGHAEFPANVLPTDQLFVLGGRTGPAVPSPNVTELYTLTSDRWTAAAPTPACRPEAVIGTPRLKCCRRTRRSTACSNTPRARSWPAGTSKTPAYTTKTGTSSVAIFLTSRRPTCTTSPRTAGPRPA